MSVWSAFTRGTARVWLHKRLILWLYLINLVFAAVLVFPFRKIIGEIAKTDLADRFVSTFSLESAFEFWYQHSMELKALAFSAVGLGVLYLLINVFLTGGIVAALATERRVSLRRFVHDAGRYFGRYVRLLILLGILGGLVAVGYHVWLAEFVKDLREQATTDRAAFLWRALVVVLALGGLALLLMGFDYAKIRTVVERRRSMMLATLFGFAFAFRRPWRTIPLFGLNLVIVGLLGSAYLLIAKPLSRADTTSMISLFTLQQIFILSRIWMRLSFFSTQMAYYHSTRHPSPSPPTSGERS